MKKSTLTACLIATVLCLTAAIANAQQRVHALSGTVTAINPKVGMIEIDTDDGSSGHFELQKKATPIDFDKTVSADATPADKFTAKGAHVIVYYFGEGQVRTIVALHDLGDSDLGKSTGTIVKLNRHDRLLTIKSSAGTEQSFRLDPKTVADTPTGVAEGLKFDLDKGSPVRVTASKADGNATALLIAPVM
jgi:hypothetical protein